MRTVHDTEQHVARLNRGLLSYIRVGEWLLLARVELLRPGPVADLTLGCSALPRERMLSNILDRSNGLGQPCDRRGPVVDRTLQNATQPDDTQLNRAGIIYGPGIRIADPGPNSMRWAAAPCGAVVS